MAEIIVITSGKGGVGKTTTTANVGVGLSMLGKRVAVIDTDLGLRNLDLALGLENLVVYDITDAVAGDCRVREALVKDSKYGALAFLPASQFKDKSSLTPDQLKEVVEELKDKYEYILIDCPAGIEQGFTNAVAAAQKAVVVVNPEPYSLRDADRIAGLLEQAGIKDIRLVINRMREDLVNKGVMLNIDSIIEALAIRLLGVVPEDENVIVAGIAGTPVVLNLKNPAGQAFYDIARRLTGEQIPVVEIRKKGFFKRMFRK